MARALSASQLNVLVVTAVEESSSSSSSKSSSSAAAAAAALATGAVRDALGRAALERFCVRATTPAVLAREPWPATTAAVLLEEDHVTDAPALERVAAFEAGGGRVVRLRLADAAAAASATATASSTEAGAVEREAAVAAWTRAVEESGLLAPAVAATTGGSVASSDKGASGAAAAAGEAVGGGAAAGGVPEPAALADLTLHSAADVLGGTAVGDAAAAAADGVSSSVPQEVRDFFAARGAAEAGAGVGAHMLWAPAVTSTHAMLAEDRAGLTRLPHGTVFMAGVQTAGRGRGANRWLSPGGSMSLTIVLDVPASVPPAELVHTQYLLAMAAVRAAAVPALKIKWPNDLHTADGKVGGILVATEFMEATRTFRLIASMGANVCNEGLGGGCVNAARRAAGEAPFASPVHFAGHVVRELNALWRRFTRDEAATTTTAGGRFATSGLRDEFHGMWLHTDQVVTVGAGPTAVKGTIVGIADNGYLDVRNHATGATVEVHPDGNSFDMLQGLIVAKAKH